MLDKKVFINLPFELVLGSSWAAWTIGSGTGVWTWAEIGACLGAGLAAAALPKKFNNLLFLMPLLCEIQASFGSAFLGLLSQLFRSSFAASSWYSIVGLALTWASTKALNFQCPSFEDFDCFELEDIFETWNNSKYNCRSLRLMNSSREKPMRK